MIQHLARLLIVILLAAPAFGASHGTRAQAGQTEVQLTRDMMSDVAAVMDSD